VTEIAAVESRSRGDLVDVARPIEPSLYARFRSVVVRESSARILACAAVALSLATSLLLMFLFRELGGAGDQIFYYRQAASLLPFNDHFYGPGYFVALRLVHDLTTLSWFASGKLVSWLSAVAFLFFVQRFYARVLPPTTAWLALSLVALNPIVIGQSYSALTTMCGAAVVMWAIALSARASEQRVSRWLGVGAVFGAAYLVRFQALGFLAGAICGVLALETASWRRSVRLSMLLAVGAAIPIAGWYALLLATQGFLPQNYNFVHLTRALGQFESFDEVPALIQMYGSLTGLLTSSPLVVPKIAIFAAKELVIFPFRVAFPLLFLSAGFLLPGALRLAVDRKWHTAWLGAFAVGLVLTGIGSRRWPHYYTIIVPFAILLVAHALASHGDAVQRKASTTGWAVLIVTTLFWSGFQVYADFREVYWPEFTVARQWIERASPNAVVSATAGGLAYGSRFTFVDLNNLIHPGEWNLLVEKLRGAHVNYLVVSERHGMSQFPEFADLLRDGPRDVPVGLRRDMRIDSPRRLAIFAVVVDDSTSAKP
jgi:hypothetical protein